MHPPSVSPARALPLRARLRRTLSRALNHRAGAPLRAAHEGLAAAELAVLRTRDRLLEPDPTPAERADVAEHLTIVVKTFLRPDVCRRLLCSAREVFDGRIVVADDSPTPLTVADPRVDVVALPFDSGVAVGRNRALAEVDTEFTFITDDDHVLSRATRLHEVIDYLRRNPEVDIVGMGLMNLPERRVADVGTDRMTAGTLPPLREHGELVDGLPVRLMVAQNYVARTASLRRIGWDEGVRMLDHRDFFHRASGRLLTVLDLSVGAYHVRTPYRREYMRHRRDHAADREYLQRKWTAVAMGRAPSDVTRWDG
ncbi:glycosyltransferase [Micrococcus sp.]|uniref:glycosyltransferase n=1 Tax=Micrococcus sp. TaxID=1271 RepID=UPI002A91E146|nr:glycosyltransferase [Micrococcus sp.]MDY6055276.1 glycosyltransferase [Micrococcus sp.]